MTVEQMVREVLEVVAADGHLSESLAAGADPQTFTAGDLVGPANRLAALLAGAEGRATAAETFANWWAAVPYPMGVGSRDIARAAWDAAAAAERARIERAVGDFWDCSEVESDPAAACDKLLAAIRSVPPSS
jgi:hypothetical protein